MPDFQSTDDVERKAAAGQFPKTAMGRPEALEMRYARQTRAAVVWIAISTGFLAALALVAVLLAA